MDQQPRHTTLVVVLGVLAFLLFVGETGPERMRDVTPVAQQLTSDLAPGVLPLALEQTITHSNPSTVHLPTPDPLRGIYSTGWTAGTPTRLRRVLGLFDGSILNAVVIDIKDATGKLSYQPIDPTLAATGVGTNRIANLAGVISQFHERGIYVMGRIAVMQDPFYAKLHPEDALHDIHTGAPWVDYKGIAWLDPSSERVRDYVAAIARDAYAQGFDEINVDYVRFPSDGDLKSIDLSHLIKNKAETMQEFFVLLRADLEGIPLSADVFGLTMSAGDDVGIGQKAVLIAPSVDALAPMVYPSHFWNGSYGIPVPATEPYKVIYKSLSDGIAKLAAAGIDKSKLRPWLQDFDLLGVPYGPIEVLAQIQAAHDLGIESWVLWDPANTYTPQAFKLEQ